jgi:hypothetical protein
MLRSLSNTKRGRRDHGDALGVPLEWSMRASKFRQRPVHLRSLSDTLKRITETGGTIGVDETVNTAW